MTPIEKQRDKVARLQAELQKTNSEAAADLAAHSDFVLSDDNEEAAFGSAKAAALLRKAGESRVRADSLAHVLGEAQKQLLDGARAEERRVLAIRWTESNVASAERLAEAKAVAAACAQFTAAYERFAAANERLYAAMPNRNTVDMDAGYLRQEQIAGAVRTELARLGCPLVAAVDQPHILEHMSEKFARADKWIRSMATGD